jgi:hypothetical protein
MLEISAAREEMIKQGFPDPFRIGYYKDHLWEISTVFLGIDHSFGGDEPLLWETMINGEVMMRYSSELRARESHLDLVRDTQNAPE